VATAKLHHKGSGARKFAAQCDFVRRCLRKACRPTPAFVPGVVDRRCSRRSCESRWLEATARRNEGNRPPPAALHRFPTRGCKHDRDRWRDPIRTCLILELLTGCRRQSPRRLAHPFNESAILAWSPTRCTTPRASATARSGLPAHVKG
jgi:hypothetical protein